MPLNHLLFLPITSELDLSSVSKRRPHIVDFECSPMSGGSAGGCSQLKQNLVGCQPDWSE
jgi:hypothetical protein